MARQARTSEPQRTERSSGCQRGLQRIRSSKFEVQSSKFKVRSSKFKISSKSQTRSSNLRGLSPGFGEPPGLGTRFAWHRPTSEFGAWGFSELWSLF